MPLFEYVCEECGETFEELVMSSSTAKEIRCPFCASDLVRKLISSFSASFSGSRPPASRFGAASACGTRST